jgi:copper chaperone CopZ
MKHYTLHIDGMSCGHCLNAVNQALHAVPGAEVGTVRIGRAEVSVPDDRDPDALVTAVEEAGYGVALVEESR